MATCRSGGSSAAVSLCPSFIKLSHPESAKSPGERRQDVQTQASSPSSQRYNLPASQPFACPATHTSTCAGTVSAVQLRASALRSALRKAAPPPREIAEVPRGRLGRGLRERRPPPGAMAVADVSTGVGP